jgi:hypothetical protein
VGKVWKLPRPRVGLPHDPTSRLIASQGVLHARAGVVLALVEALRVDPQKHAHAVSGLLGDSRRFYASIKSGRDAGVP